MLFMLRHLLTYYSSTKDVCPFHSFTFTIHLSLSNTLHSRITLLISYLFLSFQCHFLSLSFISLEPQRDQKIVIYKGRVLTRRRLGIAFVRRVRPVGAPSALLHILMGAEITHVGAASHAAAIYNSHGSRLCGTGL